MSKEIQMAATVAVFQRQLNTDRAVRYVVDKTGADAAMATEAVKYVMVSYKKK